jgi:hypothetical protein
MGASASKSMPAGDDDDDTSVDAAVASKGARLYLFDGANNKWLLHRSLVSVTFVNASDDNDTEDAAPAWHVEVRASYGLSHSCRNVP